MRPFDKFGERFVFKTEFFLRNFGDKLGARFALRIEKFFARSVGEKMLFVGFGQKRRLMMIEPPRQAFVGRIFEINNRVFIAVKLFVVKSISGAVHRRRVETCGSRMNYRLIKFGKNGG